MFVLTHRDYPWHCVHIIPVRSSKDWDKNEEDQLFVHCTWGNPPRPDRQADRTHSAWRIGSKRTAIRTYAALRSDIGTLFLFTKENLC